jgi:hypothetical protein
MSAESDLPADTVSDIDGDDAPDSAVAAIIIRATELGFEASRVATALGVSPDGVAAIQRRTGTTTDARAHGDQPGDATTRSPGDGAPRSTQHAG